MIGTPEVRQALFRTPVVPPGQAVDSSDSGYGLDVAEHGRWGDPEPFLHVVC